MDVGKYPYNHRRVVLTAVTGIDLTVRCTPSCRTLTGMRPENSLSDSSPMSVLLVEDAAPIRARLAAMIADIPCLQLIGQAATIVEARRQIETANPTAVILDLGLPDGSGLDVLRHVRETGRKCVVIVLSNYLDSETHNYCVELGADFVFSKSDEFEQAIDMLRGLAGGENTMCDRPETTSVRRVTLAVTSPIGIHARPAAMLVKLAQSFEADIIISLNGQSASVKSILGVLTLCAGCGAKVQIAAAGADAEKAIQSISNLFYSRFDEPPETMVIGSTGVTILIAGDEGEIRHMVKRILYGCGYRTVTVRSGLEAMAFLSANRGAVAATIIDQNISEMNGLDVLSCIRRINPDLPVLIISGSFESFPVATDGPTAFLRKPFGRPELIPVLRTLLEGGGRRVIDSHQ